MMIKFILKTPRPEKQIRLNFNLGLGDCANLCAVLRLYQVRGWDVAVHYAPDKTALFDMAGLPWCVQKVTLPMPWPNPPRFLDPCAGREGNTMFHNLNRYPLPVIGERETLWHELAQLDLVARPESKSLSLAWDYLEDSPGPVVLVHGSGHSSPHKKNLQPEVLRSVCLGILDAGGTVVAVGHSQPKIKHHCFTALPPTDLGLLFGLMAHADLLIGIDSGPLHAALFSSIPVLGVFTRHHPFSVCLPRKLSTWMVPVGGPPEGVVEYPGTAPTAQAILDQAFLILEKHHGLQLRQEKVYKTCVVDQRGSPQSDPAAVAPDLSVVG